MTDVDDVKDGGLYQIENMKIVFDENEGDENGFYERINGQCAVASGRSVRLPTKRLKVITLEANGPSAR